MELDSSEIKVIQQYYSSYTRAYTDLLLVLPPLLANSLVGVVLYTSYLAALPVFRREENKDPDRLEFRQTFLAGGFAGCMQSLAAAPIDAIFHRFSVSELLTPGDGQLEKQHMSLWRYSFQKLQSIGLRGVMAGFSLSLVKESASFAMFFSTFEAFKQWSYKQIVEGGGAPVPRYADAKRGATVSSEQTVESIRDKPSAAIYPATVLGAGAAATIALQGVQYPLNRLQDIHLTRLETFDFSTLYEQAQGAGAAGDARRVSGRELARIYLTSYRLTFAEARHMKERNGGGRTSWPRWLYRGFVRHTLSAVPSSSVGLFVFEIMRIRYIENTEGMDVTLDA